MDEYTTTTMKFENAIVRVHRPILTDEERARRMKLIEKAAIDLIRAGDV